MRRYYTDLVDRATRTAAQTAAALLGTTAVGMLDIDWAQIAGVSAVAFAASVLTTIATRGLTGRTEGADS